MKKIKCSHGIWIEVFDRGKQNKERFAFKLWKNSNVDKFLYSLYFSNDYNEGINYIQKRANDLKVIFDEKKK